MADQVLQIAEDMQDFVGDFLAEADELISALDNDLVTLEKEPDRPGLMDNIFRAAHTIKGNSSFLGLDQVSGLTHKMEDVLNRLRKNEINVTAHIMDVLLESVDGLKILLEDVREGKLVLRDMESVSEKLHIINEAETSESIVASGSPNSVSSAGISPVGDTAASATVSTLSEGSASEASSTTVAAAPGAAANRPEKTVRVDVDRLDALMDLVGELVLGRNTLVQANTEVATSGIKLETRERMGTVSSQINFVTTELQTAVMNLRMFPVSKVFSRFPRLIRDLASASGKKIKLELSGESTELDKTVIEEIGDPLVHLIRNSCDHGIEMPEDRLAAGKPEVGTVWLSAAQQGSNIVVTIRDDGKGLDVEALKAKAVERGLVSQLDVEKLSNKEIYKFIFAAGFSTAKVVTDVSGRGVGMDVVRTNINKLNGVIELDSEVGKGTTTIIKLPLTLAIIQGLLVKAGDDIYVIPLASVLETVKVSHSEIKYINGNKVIRLRETVLPILSLKSVLRADSGSEEEIDKSYIVVVGLADQRLGIVVDDLLGQEEVVIKSLGKLFGTVEGLAGATILGDGRIRLITDIAGLFALARQNAC